MTIWAHPPPRIAPSIGKHHHPEPRQGVPHPAEALSCARQCSVATIPLRYINAASIAYPNPSGLVKALHIVFVPSAAQAKAAAIRRCGRSQALPYANELPQLLPRFAP